MEATRPVLDLTREAELGELQPAYFRESQILETLEVLSRQNPRNVLLVGGKGVGKTRLVRGIAVAGVRGETVGLLENFRILELDLGLILVGTDELRERLQGLIRYLRMHRDNFLFVDDIHQIIELESSSDAQKRELANLLRHALFRGEISCIATIRSEKFNESTNQHKALWDHFEVVEIEPMSVETTRKTLGRLRGQLELHHKIEIPDECLDAVVDLCERFLPESLFPGKAVEVIDRACAKARFKSLSSDHMQNMIEKNAFKATRTILSKRDVQIVVKEMANVTADRLTITDKWLKIEKSLRNLFVGQSYAVTEILRTLKALDARRGDTARPEAVFLFCGPRNSGKTLMASELARLYLGSATNLLRLDMEGFTEEKFTMALFGVQQEPPNRRSSQIRTRSITHAPSVVVLFDMIEKAEPKTFDFLMPILRMGTFQDRLGRTLLLRNTIVAFTTMEGADQMTREGFEGFEEKRLAHIRSQLRPEFAAALDSVIPFMPLTKEHVHQMIQNRVRRIRKELKSRQIGVAMSEEVYRFMADSIGSETIGLIGIFAILDRLLVGPIRKLVSDGRPKPGMAVCILLKENQLHFSLSGEDAPSTN